MKKVFFQLSFICGLLLFWQLATTYFAIPTYLLPSPLDILNELEGNRLLIHSSITIMEAISGFAMGAALAMALSLGIFYSKKFELLSYPFLILSQTTPKIAIAPLLVMWFGYGILPKIIIAATISFFPIAINTVKGLRSVDQEILDVMASYRATKNETLLRVRIPAALPFVFAGLKIAITLSVIGAVVGEFVGADVGLGYLIMQSNATLNTPLMFAALVLLGVIGAALFAAIHLIEKKMVRWHPSE